MSWIKTLWLWKEVALCLLLGLSLVWGHMWWMAGELVPASSDKHRCPLLIKNFHPMFYSSLAAWIRWHSLWLAVPAPAGESGPAGQEEQGRFKEQDTGLWQRNAHSSTPQSLKVTYSTPPIFLFSLRLPWAGTMWQHIYSVSVEADMLQHSLWMSKHVFILFMLLPMHYWTDVCTHTSYRCKT